MPLNNGCCQRQIEIYFLFFFYPHTPYGHCSTYRPLPADHSSHFTPTHTQTHFLIVIPRAISCFHPKHSQNNANFCMHRCRLTVIYDGHRRARIREGVIQDSPIVRPEKYLKNHTDNNLIIRRTCVGD